MRQAVRKAKPAARKKKPSGNRALVPAAGTAAAGAGPALVPSPAPAAAPKKAVKAEKKTNAPEKVEAAPAADVAAVPEVLGEEATAPKVVVTAELLIPPPPPDMAQKSRARARKSSGVMEETGKQQGTVPSADTATSAARENVTEPATQTDAEAKAAAMKRVKDRPAPSPEIIKLCDDIKEKIRKKRPVSKDALLKADPEEKAKEVGTELANSIAGKSTQVEGNYEEVKNPPAKEAEQISKPIPADPAAPAPAAAKSANATPKAVPPEDLSLDADVNATEAKMKDAGMISPVADQVKSGPVADAREALGGLKETAAADPAKVIAEQAAAITSSRESMAALEAKAVSLLKAGRGEALGGAGKQQGDMVTNETATRESISKENKETFDLAQKAVGVLLTGMKTEADTMWENGQKKIVQEFDTSLDGTKAMVKERHSGVGGFLKKHTVDRAFGLPDSITDRYSAAEKKFGDDVCVLIKEISSFVNGIIEDCESLVDTANETIQKKMNALPEDLRLWAEGEKAKFQERADNLKGDIQDAKKKYTKDLVNKAAGAVDQARARIEALREAAKGWIQKAVDFVKVFLDDPVRALINGLLMVVGIPVAAFWATMAKIEHVAKSIADDPIAFGKNLLRGVGQGFERFMKNIFANLRDAFVGWIFSAAGGLGVNAPKDYTFRGMMIFALELMDLTWEKLRPVFVKNFGEKAVGMGEEVVRFIGILSSEGVDGVKKALTDKLIPEPILKAFEWLKVLVTDGPMGLFELIKEQLQPAVFVADLIKAAVTMVVEMLVISATEKILSMFNPAGAVYQAIKAIYLVLKWIFENAARLFSFVQTVVDSMADVVAGNVAGVAEKVELALVKLLIPVIDFIAGFAGLGNLPEKVAKYIVSLREKVFAIASKVIGFLARKAKAILAKFGIGKKKKPGEKDDDKNKGKYDGEIGETKKFKAGGENHKLWFTQGAKPTLKVASDDPGPVVSKLRDWSRRKDEELKGGKKGVATKNLNAAVKILTVVETDAGKTAKAKKDAAKKPELLEKAKKLDDLTEEEQEQIKGNLMALFTVFGEGPDLAIVFKKELDAMPANTHEAVKKEFARRSKIYGKAAREKSWAKIKTLLTGKGSSVRAYFDQPLGSSTKNESFQQDNFNTTFVAEGFNKAKTEVLAGISDSDEKLKITDRIGPEPAYITRRRGVIHGSESVEGENMRKEAKSLLDKLQTYLFKGSAKAATYAPAKAYFKKTILNKKAPEHSDYTPEIKADASGMSGNVLTLKYDYPKLAETEGRKVDFEITVTLDDAAQQTTYSSKGENIGKKIQAGRGATDGASHYDFVAGKNKAIGKIAVASAHLVPDQLMGSGKKGGLNIVVTSQSYNVGAMATEERKILGTINEFIKTVPEHSVTLTVTAVAKHYPDSKVGGLINKRLKANTTESAADDKKRFEETYAYLKKKKDPEVVQSVDYSGHVERSSLKKALKAGTKETDQILIDILDGTFKP